MVLFFPNEIICLVLYLGNLIQFFQQLSDKCDIPTLTDEESYVKDYKQFTVETILHNRN